MLLQTFLEQRRDSPLVRDHPRDNCLFLLGTQNPQFRCHLVLVLVEMVDGLDTRRVYVFQEFAVLMYGQDVVVEPLPFHEQHLKFFSLTLVQSLLDDLALVDLADLRLAFQASVEQGFPY